VRESVNLLMDATDVQRADMRTPIETPEDLHHALKIRTGRALVGDFAKMLQLLSGVLREVTPAELDKLPLSASDLDHGRERLARSGKPVQEHDLAQVVGALWGLYGADFAELVKTWKGKPGPLRRLVQALEQAAAEGKL
jgi:hypothetical protein